MTASGTTKEMIMAQPTATRPATRPAPAPQTAGRPQFVRNA